MRIWYGIDVEHNLSYGHMTLFVESENPDIDKILNILLESNLGIEYVYFGAGEVDIKNWDFLDKLSEIADAFIVGLETSIPISPAVMHYFDFIIFRLPIPKVSDKIYIKYRADSEVGIAKLDRFLSTSLLDLRGGQYKGDVEIYREE